MLYAATSPIIPFCGSRNRARCPGSTGDAIPLHEQLLNLLIRLLVGPLAKMPVADVTVGVYQIPRGPETLVVRVPDGVIVVQHDRVLDVFPRDGLAHVGDVLLETELRRVDPDYEQAVVPVLFIQRVDVRLRVLAVEAAIRPELDQHYLIARGILYRDAIRVDEAGRACNLFGPAVLLFLVGDPLRVGDNRFLLLASVTRSILAAPGPSLDPSGIFGFLFNVRLFARRLCAGRVETEFEKHHGSDDEHERHSEQDGSGHDPSHSSTSLSSRKLASRLSCSVNTRTPIPIRMNPNATWTRAAAF